MTGGKGMPVLLRRMDYVQDGEAILACMPDLYESNFAGFVADAPFLARRRQALREAARDPAQEVLVLDADGRLAGFVWLVMEIDYRGRRQGEVAAIYVKPQWRGRGLGRMLMEEAEAVFRHWGCHSVQLMVTARNEAAVGLYRSLGYGVTRHQMEKPLRP